MNNINFIYIPIDVPYLWAVQNLVVSNGWQNFIIRVNKSSNVRWMVIDLFHRTTKYTYTNPNIHDKTIKLAKSMNDIVPFLSYKVHGGCCSLVINNARLIENGDVRLTEDNFIRIIE